ncbi:Uncharacterised protein g8078 [Pycnogonum litorale]
MEPNFDSSGKRCCKEDHEFNRLLFTRIGKLFPIFFPGVFCRTTFITALFFGLTLIKEIVVFFCGLIPAGFVKVIVDGNKEGFLWQFVVALILVILRAFSTSTKLYARCLLAADWRKTLSRHLNRLYFTGKNYYDINVIERNIDNPDQRMAQDVYTMVKAMAQVIADVVLRPFTITYYTYQVYLITGAQGVMISYSLIFIFVLLNVRLLSPIVRTTAELEKQEGNFRYQHMHIRVYAESIALQGSEVIEEKLVDEKLDAVIDAMHDTYWQKYLAVTGIDTFASMKDVLSFAVLGVPYFAGDYSGLSAAELGKKATKNCFIVGHLVYMFTDLIDNATEIGEMAGSIHRVAELLEEFENKRKNSLDEIPRDDDACRKKCGNLICKIKDLSVLPPTKSTKPILSNLKLNIKLKTNTLICGSGNCGKTSVLRIIRGLWPVHRGSVWCSELIKDAIYLPQKPLLTSGSLRKQLWYPKAGCGGSSCSDEQIVRYFEKFQMMGLYCRTGGLDEEVDWNWYDVLSPSEAHRLCFIRMFYHRPKVGLLDDVLGTIDHAIIDFIFRECDSVGITLVTIGDEEMLGKYHRQILRLNIDGTWTLKE